MLIRRTMATVGLLAFAVVLLGGVISDNSLEHTLTRAIWSLLGFCAVGLIVGWAADHVVREHRAQQFKTIFGHAEGEAPPAPEPQEMEELIEATPVT